MTEVLLVGSYPEHEFAHVVREAKRETGIPIRSVDMRRTPVGTNPTFSSYLQEYASLGTAGGIYHFRDVITLGQPDAVLVLHSNLCCDYPLKGGK
jgi:mannose-1-phosphate guanylyltransferase